jgi:hypothetical protein
MDEIISFHPDSIRVLRVLSRGLVRAGEDFLQWNMGEVVTWCSDVNSTLCSLISRDFATARNPPGSQTGRIGLLFHLSVPASIRSLGVPLADCPDRILTQGEMHQFNDRIENANLQRAWGSVSRQIMRVNPAPGGLPEASATAQEIRSWMHAEVNQPVVQSITFLSLENLGLTCVPKETGLCTGLTMLRLGQNQLRTLPEGVFPGMGALVGLDLSDNELEFLPEAAFWGLAALRTLCLYSNRLVSLPERLFQGLVSLRSLYMASNLFDSFPKRLFQGLEALERLKFDFYRLDFLQYQTIISGREEHRISFLRTMDAFFGYACQSPFARFYQLVAEGGPLEAVKQSFSELPDTLKNSIYGNIWLVADRPDYDDPQWGNHHAFDSMRVFKLALKWVVRDRFEALTAKQKNAVYDHVCHLARSERGAETVDFNVPEWGELHAQDNILRLIDAMDSTAGIIRE